MLLAMMKIVIVSSGKGQGRIFAERVIAKRERSLPKNKDSSWSGA